MRPLVAIVAFINALLKCREVPYRQNYSEGCEILQGLAVLSAEGWVAADFHYCRAGAYMQSTSIMV